LITRAQSFSLPVIAFSAAALGQFFGQHDEVASSAPQGPGTRALKS
jgi:hypothetical protein